MKVNKPIGKFRNGIIYKIPPMNDVTTYNNSFLSGQKRRYGTFALKKMSTPK